MSDYTPPLEEINFLLHEVLAVKDVLAMEAFSTLSPELVSAVLDEAGKFAAEKLAPLNRKGDIQGSHGKNGHVTTPDGFKETYAEFVANGWNSVPFSPEVGGQGLPWMLSTAVSELWSGANMAFGLCPLLTQGAVELLSNHGSAEQRAAYLPKLVSGEWTGTMCLTEAQAGSDVGAVKTSAIKSGDNYLIKGQKIFITYGEHDLTENIIHMVLARVPNAPAGVKGISLFIVPKFLKDGSRNDVKAISIEHKLGIHASPTAVLNFGENGGAVGYLVGEENQGLKYMFTMMNNARLAVGVEGVALAEDSLQKAEAFAAERVQNGVTIDQHADVQRMLLTIRSQTEAMRALMLFVGKALDMSYSHADSTIRQQHKDIVDLLIPVLKANATDTGFFMSSEALQVFGGIGYVEETGIAQNMRDARIAMIYEGTNGIQAMDLVMRKITADNGRLFESLRPQVEAFIAGSQYETKVSAAWQQLDRSTRRMRTLAETDKPSAGMKAYYYTRLFGLVMGAALFAASDKALQGNTPFTQQKARTIRFYMDYLLVEAVYLAGVV